MHCYFACCLSREHCARFARVFKVEHHHNAPNGANSLALKANRVNIILTRVLRALCAGRQTNARSTARCNIKQKKIPLSINTLLLTSHEIIHTNSCTPTAWQACLCSAPEFGALCAALHYNLKSASNNDDATRRSATLRVSNGKGSVRQGAHIHWLHNVSDT